MTTRTHPSRFGLVPLADRIRWSNCLRAGLAVLVAGLWFARPGERHTDGRVLLVLALVVSATAVAAELAPRAGRGAAIAAVNVALLVDGAALALALQAYGGVTGPVAVLMMLHVCGVSLLTSFRSGGKIAVWHALVVLCALQAEQVGLLGAEQPRPMPMGGYLTFVLLLGAAALGTSLFAALNERELRRRRYDAEVLRSLAVELETADGAPQVAAALTRLAVEDLSAVRSLLVVEPAEDEQGRGVRFLEAGWPAAPAGAAPPLQAVRGSVLAEAGTGPVFTGRLDDRRDAYLLHRLPGAANLVVLPVPIGPAGRGWLVLDLGVRKRVEHRLMTTLVQAAAHAGLALSRAALVERLRLAAETDGLTGLANRKSFDAAFARESARVARTGEPLAVALVDLDHFKQVNDTYGHQTGDDVLRAAAAALRGVARDGDLVARYGGEEFVLLLPGVDAADAATAAGRFRAAVRTCAAPVPVTCSIGVTCQPPGGADPAVLLAAADQALYRAKKNGRDRVETGAAVPASR